MRPLLISNIWKNLPAQNQGNPGEEGDERQRGGEGGGKRLYAPEWRGYNGGKRKKERQEEREMFLHWGMCEKRGKKGGRGKGFCVRGGITTKRKTKEQEGGGKIFELE